MSATTESIDATEGGQTRGAALRGLRILVMLRPAHKEHARRLARVLEAAKAQFDWHIDVLCHAEDVQAVEALAAPKGRIIKRPHIRQHQDWESDPDAVAQIDKRMAAAEHATGVTAGLLVLASQDDIGRAFVTQARYMPGSATARQVLADNTQPFRVVRRVFAFADDLVANCEPDLILAYEWSALVDFAVWLAATGRGIPSLALRRSKIVSEHCFWTADRLMMNSAAEKTAFAKRESHVPVSDRAKSYICAFRKQPKMVKYIDDTWKRKGNRGWLSWHARFLRMIIAETIARVLRQHAGTQRSPVLGPLLSFNRRCFLKWRHQRYFRTLDEERLAATKYIYFPMHKEPELALRFQATAWHNQSNTVQVLASCLPSGYRLLVRENRLNYGDRPTRYYRRLLQLPNVVLIDAFDSQFKYLRYADLIVNENGSSGWEGLLLGRRVLTLSRTFYDGAGPTRLHDPDQLASTIVELLRRSAVADPATHERHLGYMIDAERETTFPMGPEGTEAAVQHLVHAIAEVGRTETADEPICLVPHC